MRLSVLLFGTVVGACSLALEVSAQGPPPAGARTPAPVASRAPAPAASAATAASGAELEVVSDSVGQPVSVAGVEVGRTPLVVPIRSGTGIEVIVGRPDKQKVVSLDVPSRGRIRMDVRVPRDTQFVPAVRTTSEILAAADLDARFPVPSTPVAPVQPRRPSLFGSGLGGLLVGAAVAGASAGACEQTFTSPPPLGAYVGDRYYAPGDYSLGVSSSCRASASVAGIAVGTLLFHRIRRSRYSTADRAYRQAEAAYSVAELARRAAVARRDSASRAALEEGRQADVAAQQAVLDANELILRQNRELPVVAFLNAAGARADGARTSSIPPNLQLRAVGIAEEDGDNSVRAGERGVLKVQVSNLGEGPAFDVRVEGRVMDGGVQVAGVSVGTVAPGGQAEVALDLLGLPNAADGVAKVRIVASEGSGFVPEPAEISFQTVAFRAPALVIDTVAVRDVDGRPISARRNSSLLVSIRVRNSERAGPAEGVVLSLVRDSTLLFPNSPASEVLELPLGRLRPGEARDTTIAVFVKGTAEAFGLRAGVTESVGRFGVALAALGIPLQGSAGAVTVLDATRALIPPNLQLRNPDAVAVVIGNADYQQPTVPDVDYAGRDADVVRKYLIQTFGFSPENIIFQQNASFNVFQDIFGSTDVPGQLAGRVRRDTTDVFVFYSGHGAPDPTTGSTYLVPIDANPQSIARTGFPVRRMYQALSDLRARSITVVLDACFSGVTPRGESLLGRISPLSVQVENPVLSAPNAAILTASRGEEVSNWYDQQRHGLFTYVFFEAVTRAFADGVPASIPTLRELGDRVRPEVVRLSRQIRQQDQTPQIFGSGADLPLPFVRRP